MIALGVLITGVIFFIACYIRNFMYITDVRQLETLLHANISTAKLIFWVICFIQPIALPLPEPVTVLAGSAVLGSFTAFILAFTGTSAGIITMFFAARVGGMKIVSKLVSQKQLAQYHEYVEKSEVIVLAALFIFPILPDEIICVGAGLSGVSVRRFMIIGIFCKLVTSFSLAYSLELAATLALTTLQVMMLTSGLTFTIVVLTWLLKRYWFNSNSDQFIAPSTINEK